MNGFRKSQIKKTLMRIIQHISDKSYQERVWIKGEGPEVDDFDETVCHFSQEGDGVIEKYQDFGLTDDQCKLLQKFREKFRTFANENDFPEIFINTSEWTEITEMAKEVLKAFHYQA